jgi:lipoprotein signal peptidase
VESLVAVGVPGWPAVGAGFDATPLVVLVAAFAVAALLLRVPMTGRAIAFTAAAGVALGLIAASFGPVPVLSLTVLVIAVVVAWKRNPRARRRNRTV